MRMLQNRESLKIVYSDAGIPESIQKKMDASIDLENENIHWDLARLSSISILAIQADRLMSFNYIAKKLSKTARGDYGTLHVVLSFIGINAVEELALRIEMEEYRVFSAICEGNFNKPQTISNTQLSALTTRPITVKEKSDALASHKRYLASGLWAYLGFITIFLSFFIYSTQKPSQTVNPEMFSGIYFTVQGLLFITLVMALLCILFIKKTYTGKSRNLG